MPPKKRPSIPTLRPIPTVAERLTSLAENLIPKTVWNLARLELMKEREGPSTEGKGTLIKGRETEKYWL